MNYINNNIFNYAILRRVVLLLLSNLAFIGSFINVANAIKIENWQTPEGMGVYYVETKNLPIVDIAFNIKSGSALDPANKIGVASFTEHLLLNSNGKYNEEKVAKTFADFGAEVGGTVDKDISSFKVRMLYDAEVLSEVNNVWQSLITEPKFDTKILKREVARAVADLRESLTQIGVIAQRAFINETYNTHPYGYLENEKAYKNINIQDLEKFYQNNYHPENAVIVFVGALTKDEANKIASELSQKLQKNNGKYRPANFTQIPQPANTTAKTIKINFPSEQTHIYAGMPFIERGNPDFFPLFVGNHILGAGGFTSKLMNIIREKNGLAYSIYSNFDLYKYRGLFSINLQTQNANTDRATQLLINTLTQFLNEKVSADELSAAKKFLTGSFPLRLDSNAKILGLVSMIATYNLPLDYLDTWMDKVNAVTADDIKNAFARNLKLDELVILQVGKNLKQ